MAARPTTSLSIDLPTEIARLVRDRVASGKYASESDVISEGLRALEARDAELDTWLREELVPAYDEFMAHPTEVVPLDAVLSGLEERYAARKAIKDR